MTDILQYIKENKRFAVSLLALFVCMIAVVLFLAQLKNAQVAKESAKENVCEKIKTTRTVAITKKGFTPNKISAHVCDQLVFVNSDTTEHLPALGEHEHHTQYAGFTERTLKKGEKNSFILVTKGTFPLHDHLNDAIEGTLTIR